MVKYDYEKITEMLLYVAERYRDDRRFGTTRLTKVMFWAEFEQYAKTGEPIAGGHYVRMTQGPMLAGLQDRLLSLAYSGAIAIVERPSGGQTPLRVPVPLRAPDMSSFTSDEIALLDRVIAEHRGESASKVSDLSHTFLGWQATKPRHTISYNTALVTKPELTPEERAYGLALSEQLAAVGYGR